MKKRKGKRSIEIGGREPNGRRQRGSRAERRDDVEETVLAYRVKVFGVSPIDAKAEQAETVFGRLFLNAELSPFNSALNEKYYEYGVDFFFARRAYLKAKCAPPPLGSAGNLERMRGHDGSDGTDPEYVGWCASAIRRYEEMRDAIVDHGKFEAYAAAKRIISDDEDCPKLIGDLRMALNGITAAQGQAGEDGETGGMSEGTALFMRAMAFDYADDERGDLMRKVWAGTPFMTSCKTGSPSDDLSREITDWCREKWGDEAWPIHGRGGRWQRGGATVFGWTWFGFETAEMLAEFEEAWECRDEV